jgi:hypothetical protein
LAVSSGGELVLVSQSIAYGRRPSVGESLQSRIFSHNRTEGERREAIVVLVLCDVSGVEIARSESRLAIAVASERRDE